jgi:cytochrome c5
MVQRPLSTNRRARLALVPFAAALLVACQESGPAGQAPGVLPPADQLLLAAAKVALPPAGVTPADLPDAESQGANLVAQYCAYCHDLPTPGSHSATDWPRYMRRMWVRTEGLHESYEIPVPTRGERQIMLQYMMDHALQVSSELPAVAGRDFFTQTCGDCHELPDPKQHSPDDWVAVVRRMMDHMQTMLGSTLTPDQYSRIVLYLETASR